MTVDTQVAIVGAGPAGLVLGQLLHRAGIATVVLEARDRPYVESRVRAGVLEYGTVELLDRLGVSERLHREGAVHYGVNFQFNGERHRLDFRSLVGKSITIYGQQEVVKDLIAARLSEGGPLYFEVSDVTLEGVDGPVGGEPRPVVRYRHRGQSCELRCDVIAGCDGFHGVCRPTAFSDGGLCGYERIYPFAWLGVLAQVAPSSEELIYSWHPHGFALHSLRSPRLSRLYLQVDPSDPIDAWPDERIWRELQVRLASPGWTLHEGPIVEKGITPMRSFVAEPMQRGRLFLAGDAAHIVPPTGAKGMNLAVADVYVLAAALVSWYRRGDTSELDGYSAACLERVWRVQDFSATMTGLFHVDPADDEFSRRVQAARQAYVWHSPAMAASLAENYVGLPLSVADRLGVDT